MKTLVLVADGSNYFDVAARCIASKTLFGNGMTAHAVHCIPDLPGDVKSLVGGAKVDMWYAEEGTGATASVYTTLGAVDVSFERYTLVGFPPERIVHHAQSTGAAVIIAGSHGRDVSVEALMSSMTDWVLAYVECPVVLVKTPKI